MSSKLRSTFNDISVVENFGGRTFQKTVGIPMGISCAGFYSDTKPSLSKNFFVKEKAKICTVLKLHVPLYWWCFIAAVFYT